MVSQHLRLLGAIKRPVCRDMSINGQMSHFFKSRLTALFISSNWMGSTRFNLNSIYGNDNNCNYSRFLFITIKDFTIWWSKRLRFFSLCLFILSICPLDGQLYVTVYLFTDSYKSNSSFYLSRLFVRVSYVYI